MISIKNLSKTYGTRVLFDDVNFDVLAGERIGLVGRNGHGKTTLFRILTGEEEAEKGRISLPRNYRLGYLGQHLICTEPTVLEEGCKGLRPDEASGAWKVEKILSGLGFSQADLSRSPSEFSGGYLMRIALTKVLVSEPDMLLLDEPTNFLDIVSIRWAEKFLKSWKGELIVISHDRDFIDSVTTHIVGIHRGKVRKMKGSSAKYYEQLRKDEQIYEKRRLEDEKKREEMMDYINTFRAQATRARAVQSSIKKLEKMEKLKKLEEISTLSFSFNYSGFRSPQIMDVTDLTFSYSGSAPYLIEGLNLTVNRNDKICIVGKNGAGKTTLLKLLSGRLTPVLGSVKTHVAAVPAYYEQANTADLNDGSTVEEEITPRTGFIDKSRVRGICGAMMFSGDDAEKKVGILSGGERSRVLLGKLLIAPSNILFLDEPTHHLDIESCQAMMDAVRDFEGAAIVVAHDEHFLKEVATKLIVFKNGRVVVYPGTYQEFLESGGWEDNSMPVIHQQRAARNKPAAIPPEPDKEHPQEPPVTPSPEPSHKARPRRGKLKRRERAAFIATRSKVLKPLEKKAKDLEEEILSCEKNSAEMNKEISTPGIGALRRSSLSRELTDLNKKINALYSELDRTLQEYDCAKQYYQHPHEQSPRPA